MTLTLYCILIGIVTVFYLIGIALHGEVKETFREIKNDMQKAKSDSVIKKDLKISYPCFLALRRAIKAEWLVSGFYSILTLLFLIGWFAVTIINIVSKGVQFSDKINIVDTFGALGIVQPSIVILAIVILFNYWREINAFNSWRK